jgi:hypothetical protein
MNTYIVHRRRGQPFHITAHAYTEDKRAKRVYFHKLADQSDRDSFCFLSEIAAIDKKGDFGFESLEQLLARAKSSPEMMRTLTALCDAERPDPPPMTKEEWEKMLSQLPSEFDAKNT